MAKDRARDRAAAAAGWLTLRVLDAEVATDPDGVLRDLEAAYRTRVLPPTPRRLQPDSRTGATS